MARLGCHGKTLQLGVARLLQPGGKRVAASGAQRLLRGPERIAAAARVCDQEVRQIHSRGSERGRIWDMGRAEPDGAVTRAGERRQRRQHQLELADARFVRQELSQPLARPTASREHGVEGRETRGQRSHRLGESAAAPDRVVLENGIESHGTRTHTVFSYSIRPADKPA